MSNSLPHHAACFKVKLLTVSIAASLFSSTLMAADILEGRAVLDAATFAPGPTSGAALGAGPINGQPLPFVGKQPVQGFSAILDNGDGSFQAMPDNGYGSLENSADFNLRVYTIRPYFKTKKGGSGAIQVERFIELHDPDKHIPYTITNQFSARRVLTGADLDIESMQRVSDGTLWFGDEFGPFLIHTAADGRVLEAPVVLPDFDNPGKDNPGKDNAGKQIRSPQNPFNEEASAVRIMNAARRHAQLHGNNKPPVFSPTDQLLDDGNAATFVGNRANPPAGSGLKTASSEIFNVKSLQAAGYPVVPYTVDDPARMQELLRLGVNGLISDRPDLLFQAVAQFDANQDGKPGDFLTADGLIDNTKFDAQGHRGGRNLRPENTLPAYEVGLDNLMTTLETDSGISADGVPVISHDPYIEAAKCRHADGTPYLSANDVLIKNLTVAQIQRQFICDVLLPGRPDQTNNLALSPVSVAFTARLGLHPYVKPTVQQMFDFVNFYVDYYRRGAGRSQPDATRRWKNAQRVRFNIETKLNPRSDRDPLGNVFSQRTIGPLPFARKVASVIVANRMEARADIQSFDFRTLLVVQEQFPKICTVYLFGDFPIYANPAIAGSDDGTNMQDEHGANTPWMAGMAWPYRVTTLAQPFRAQRSGGFEGMALTDDGRKLIPLLEKPLSGGAPGTLLMHEFDLASKAYTGVRYPYPLDPRSVSIGDFILFDKKRGYVIERDDSQGRLDGFKAIYRITLAGPGQPVKKELAVDLLNIKDPQRISEPGLPGDVGIGKDFAFPFVTIEDVVVMKNRGKSDPRRIGVLNDNNYPFSVGRHAGSGKPDDNEFIVLQLDGLSDKEKQKDK